MWALTHGRWDVLSYGLQLRLSGFDFGSVDLDNLGLDPRCCNSHVNSGGPDLHRVLQKLGIPPGSRAFDFGSGKGGAALTLSAFPFDEITGIEISAELIRIAEANVRRAGVKNVHFLCQDAAEFTDLDRFTHLYMYHPFPCHVVEAVCKNLAASLLRRPRSVTLVYRNPVCHEGVMRTGLFQVQFECNFVREAPEDSLLRVYLHPE